MLPARRLHSAPSRLLPRVSIRQIFLGSGWLIALYLWLSSGAQQPRCDSTVPSTVSPKSKVQQIPVLEDVDTSEEEGHMEQHSSVSVPQAEEEVPESPDPVALDDIIIAPSDEEASNETGSKHLYWSLGS
eukprot:6829871-Pyramimonas_sp.AAC.1